MNEREHAEWKELEALLDELMDLPQEQWEQRLEELEASDGARRRILEMLATEQSGGGALDRVLGQLATCSDGRHLEGRVIGRWQLVRLLGEGGMATVWLAERADRSTEQQVAVKCLKSGLYSPEIRGRFIQEQRILARLQHPNIARMYDSGIAEDGTPYIVMECISGAPITDWCDRHRLSVEQRLALFEQVLDAVILAHRELIVHRDLKPANILVDERGDLKLLDFGIARTLDDEQDGAGATLYRALTPEYAAPEQLAGEPVAIAADVFSLGLLLHELLCGCRASRDPAERSLRPPSAQLSMRWTSRTELERIASARSLSVKRLRRLLRGDLDAIVGKALAQQADQRYSSVEGFRADLQSYRGRRPIEARAVGAGRRFGLFMQRHWIASVATATVALVLLLGIATTAQQAKRADAEAAVAQVARSEAESALARASAINRFVIELFEGEIPMLPADEMPTTRQIVDRGIDRVRDPASGPEDLRSEMMLTLANILRLRRQFDEADGLLDEALDLYSRSPQPEPSIMARALVLRADIARARRDYEATELAMDRALDFLDRQLPGSSLHLDMLRDRAFLDLHLERLDSAQSRFQDLLERIDGQDGLSALRLRLVSDLGILHGRSGNLAEASLAFEQALVLKQQDESTSLPSLANTLFNLGSIDSMLGHFDSAERRLLEIIELLEPIAERPAQVRAAAWLGLAVNAHRQGLFDLALERVEFSAEEWRRVLNQESVEQRFFIHYHSALVLADAGSYHEARQAMERALARLETSSELPEGRVAEAQALHARLMCQTNQAADGSSVLESLENRLDRTRSVVLAEAIAVCALAQGTPGTPDELLPVALLVGDERIRGDLAEVARRLVLRGELLAQQGRIEEALQAWADAERRLDELGLELHPVRSRIRQLAIAHRH